MLLFLGGCLIGGFVVGGLVLWICTVARGPALVHISDRERITTERLVPYSVDAVVGRRPCAPAERVCGCSSSQIPQASVPPSLSPAPIRDRGAVR